MSVEDILNDIYFLYSEVQQQGQDALVYRRDEYITSVLQSLDKLCVLLSAPSDSDIRIALAHFRIFIVYLSPSYEETRALLL